MNEAPGLAIIGAGGHGRVAGDAWLSSGGRLIAYFDDGSPPTDCLRAPLVGTATAALAAAIPLHIAIGSNAIRRWIAIELDDARCPSVIHPSAVVSRHSAIGAGALLCAAIVVQSDACVGRHVIVNTGAIVEHDCLIGDFAHIAPGVRLGGSVRIGAGALIGIGAVILPGISVGENAVVGAGAVVLSDVAAEVVVVGNPARYHTGVNTGCGAQI